MVNKVVSILMIVVVLSVTTIPSSPFISIVNAGIESDMEGFLDDMGVMSNIQMPGSFEAGGRNIYSGGSMSMRIDTSTPPVMTYQPPSLRVSCSGMDFNAGLISILNLDMIQDLLEQGGTSLAWGLLIGLAYSLPTVSNVFEKIQKYTRWMQQLQGNACQIGKNLGASLGGTIKESYQNKQKSEDVASGDAGTTVEAQRNIWDSPAKFGKSTRGNLVYDTLVDLGIMDDETLKAAMGIFGTIEWFPQTDKTTGDCNPDNPEEVNIIHRVYTPSMSTKTNDIIEAFVNGGEIDSYDCSANCATLGVMNTTCTGLEPTTVQLDSFREKIYDTLYSAITHLADGEELTTKEQQYINAPVMPNFTDMILYLTTQYRQNRSILADLQAISEYYSYWMLEYILSYINEAVHKSKPILLSSKEVPSRLTDEIENFYSTYRKASIDINKVFRVARETFIKEISQSQQLANMSILKGKNIIANMGTLNLGSSLSGMNK